MDATWLPLSLKNSDRTQTLAKPWLTGQWSRLKRATYHAQKLDNASSWKGSRALRLGSPDKRLKTKAGQAFT
jgi:hypothetical protein